MLLAEFTANTKKYSYSIGLVDSSTEPTYNLQVTEVFEMIYTANTVH